MKKIILLTGGTGFVGKNLSKRLCYEGYCVYNLMSSGQVILMNSDVIRPIPHSYDGTYKSLEIIIQQLNPITVFHLASVAVTTHSPEQLDEMLLVNITLPTQLMEAITTIPNCLFITLGSAWQHYRGEDYNPIGLYGATKQSVENIAKYYCNSSRLTAIHLKPFHIYGLKDSRERLVDFLINATKKPALPLNMSDGNQLINLIHVDDVIDALLFSMTLKKGTFHTYSLESKNWLSIKELVSLIENLSDKKLLINWGAKPNNNQEFRSQYHFGVTIPKWAPKVSLANGLKGLLKQ